MRRRSVQIAVVLLWLAMTIWLVRYEAFPGFFVRTSPGYRSLFRDSPLLLDSWMKITFDGSPIGYSQTQVDTNEGDPDEQFLMNNRTLLDLNILGGQHRVIVNAQAALDALHRLQSFQFVLSSRAYTARIRGTREHGRTFAVQLKTGSSTQKLSVEIPDDVIIHSPMVGMSLYRLKPGQEQRIRTLDPASLSIMDVLVRAVGSESLRLGEREYKTTLLLMDYNGMEVRSWIDETGQMIRQETPFGWTMEACTAEEALAMDTASSKPQDILGAMAVPVEGRISNPRQCRELKLRLSGVSLEPEELETPRQAVTPNASGQVELTLRAPGLPQTTPDAVPGEEFGPYLAATPFIQTGDPALQRQAQSIVEDRENPVHVARAIGDWVHRKVQKNPAVSLPSALDVLRVMEGDCNEHTYLFVALARSVGLPAKVRVGLLYLDDAFYYHAWPSVYVGQWVDMDPTLGQEVADATHVALLEGGLSEQLKLMSMVGQLRAEVLEQGY